MSISYETGRILRIGFALSKRPNLIMLLTQDTVKIFKIGIILSKRPHFYSVYLLGVKYSLLETVCVGPKTPNTLQSKFNARILSCPMLKVNSMTLTYFFNHWSYLKYERNENKYLVFLVFFICIRWKGWKKSLYIYWKSNKPYESHGTLMDHEEFSYD